MGLVARHLPLFAVGAYLGRDMSQGLGLLWFIAAFGCLLGLNVAVRKSEQLAIGLLFAFGVLIGLGTAPTIAYYASTDPQAVGRPAAPRRSSSPRSAPQATRLGATSNRSRAISSGRCSR